jgi:hypothetical protein
MEKCEREFRPEDCPKADGAPMKPPYGIEIRIFDHFPSEHLLDLMKILVLIAANAQRHPSKQYVYLDRRWITTLRKIMLDGWNTIIDKNFISAIRTNLGLPVDTHSRIAYDVLKTIVHELFEINKNSFINRIMNERPDVEPIVPEINRKCWEMAFIQKYNQKILNIIKHKLYVGQVLTMHEFAKVLYETLGDEYQNWENDINDVLYALETNNHVKLNLIDGIIKSIRIL